MEEQFKTGGGDSGGLGLKDLFFKYIRFLPWFVISVAVALLIAYTYLRYATPIYSASGTLLIKSEQQRGNANDKFEDLFMANSSKNIQNEIEILSSRNLMERVVHKLNLETSYNAVGKIKSPNVYKRAPFRMDVFEVTDSARAFALAITLYNDSTFQVNEGPERFHFGDVFQNGFGTFRLVATPYPGGRDFIVGWTPTEQVARSLANEIRVIPKTQGTGILVISLEATNPVMAADVVNELMAEYNAYTKEDKNITLSQMLSFIDDRLDVLNSDLDSIQRQLLRFRQRNNLIDVESQSQEYFQRISDADKAIDAERIQMQIADLLEGYLEKDANRHALVPSSLGINDPTLNGLVDTYNKTQLERKALIDGNTPPANLLVKQKEEMLDKIRDNLLVNIANIKKAYSTTIAQYEKTNLYAQKEFRALPEKTKELLEIQRQEESKLNLYKYLMEKREETSISKASTISNSSIVEEAAPVYEPVKPNRRSVQLLWALVGIAIPTLVIFVVEISNDKIVTRNDIEKITDVPILGEVGHSFSEKTLIVTSKSRGMVAEQFRIIRSNLQYIIGKTEKPIIITTSSFSGEGKSFITTNIGAVMALAGKKTIILEFDIRKPKILAGLDMTKGKGVINYIVSNEPIQPLIRKVEDYQNLYVLPCGPIPPNPAELLLDEKVAELFTILKKDFDIILIDTAPVGMVSDALTLSKFADATLYIVRQGHTFKKQVHLIEELYADQKLPHMSIIINDVKLKPGYGYYGYGRYGYGYGYGTGYYEEETGPPTLWGRLLQRLNPLRWGAPGKSQGK